MPWVLFTPSSDNHSGATLTMLTYTARLPVMCRVVHGVVSADRSWTDEPQAASVYARLSMPKSFAMATSMFTQRCKLVFCGLGTHRTQQYITAFTLPQDSLSQSVNTPFKVFDPILPFLRGKCALLPERLQSVQLVVYQNCGCPTRLAPRTKPDQSAHQQTLLAVAV